MLLSVQPQAVQELIGRISNNRLETEEYLDFIAARTFRGSLLTHAGQTLDLDIRPQHLLQMHAAWRSRHRRATGIASGQQGTAAFPGPSGWPA